MEGRTFYCELLVLPEAERIYRSQLAGAGVMKCSGASKRAHKRARNQPSLRGWASAQREPKRVSWRRYIRSAALMSLVEEVTSSGEVHSHSRFLGCSDNFFIADGAARLHDCADAGVQEYLEAVGEGEEGV